MQTSPGARRGALPTTLPAVLTALLLSIAVAAFAAEPRLTAGAVTVTDGITETAVSYPSGTATAHARLFLPPGNDPVPAVVFCPPEAAPGAAFDARCRDLASEGYAVFVPPYGGNGSLFEVGPEEVARVLAGDAALRGHPRVLANQVAIIGSGHGSLTALLAVADSEPRRFRCVVHACGNRGAQDRAAAIKIPLLVQVGRKDAVADYQQARFMAIDIRKAGNSSVTIKEYTMVGHDFWFWTDPEEFGVDRVNQAQWAWEDMTSFLDRHFDGTGGVNVR